MITKRNQAWFSVLFTVVLSVFLFAPSTVNAKVKPKKPVAVGRCPARMPDPINNDLDDDLSQEGESTWVLSNCGPKNLRAISFITVRYQIGDRYKTSKVAKGESLIIGCQHEGPQLVSWVYGLGAHRSYVEMTIDGYSDGCKAPAYG
jgi:hypothetical protein